MSRPSVPAYKTTRQQQRDPPSFFFFLTPFYQACKPVPQPLRRPSQQRSVEKHQSSPWSSGLAGAVMHCTTEMLDLQEGDSGRINDMLKLWP